MARVACVNVPYLELQLLLEREPDWRELPAAVVSEDKPLGIVLSANRPARAAGVESGLRYATALSLAPDLRAAVVTPQEISAGIGRLGEHLGRFSPEVESAAADGGDLGVFWVGATGLEALFVSLEGWAETVSRSVEGEGLYARVAVGFSRFGSYAATKGRGRGAVVFTSPEQEREAALRAPLSAFPLGEELQRRLAGLGIGTVNAFVNLPRGGVLRRFGPEAEAFHRFASEGLDLPVQYSIPEDEPVFTRELAAPEADGVRLGRHLGALLDLLLEEVRIRGELVAALRFSLTLEDGSERTEEVVPAEPIRTRRLLAELIDLRLASLCLEARVERLGLTAVRTRARDIQLELFRARPRRNPDAGARAFARLRAELGNQAVRLARLRDQHLPELQYAWESVERPRGAEPAGASRDPVLVRRILEVPRPLEEASAPGRLPGGPPGRPPGRSMGGPYALSGSWWVQGVRRDYYYLETDQLRWVYYDHEEGRWMLQGFVD